MLGNYAYLGKFWEPECGAGGVYIVNIADPENPKKAGFIPSHTDTYQGEGIQALPISTRYFDGDLLLYNNEICDTHGTENGVGGISLVDVTSPRKWKKLVEGYGDFTIKGKSQRKANESHSAFMWEDDQGTSSDNDDKAYVVMIDNEETTETSTSSTSRTRADRRRSARPISSTRPSRQRRRT